MGRRADVLGFLAAPVYVGCVQRPLSPAVHSPGILLVHEWVRLSAPGEQEQQQQQQAIRGLMLPAVSAPIRRCKIAVLYSRIMGFPTGGVRRRGRLHEPNL